MTMVRRRLGMPGRFVTKDNYPRDPIGSRGKLHSSNGICHPPQLRLKLILISSPLFFPRHTRFLHAIIQANQTWFCVHHLGRLM